MLHALIGADDLEPVRLRRRRSRAGARRQPAGRAAQHHAAGAVPVDAGRPGRERPAAPRRPVAVRGGQDLLDGRQPRAGDRRDRRQRALGGVARHHRPAGTARAAARPGEPSRTPTWRPSRGWSTRCMPPWGRRAPAYRPETPEERHPHLHPGRAARIVDATARDYGSLGEVHPRVAEAWGLPGRPVIAVDQPRRAAVAACRTRCWCGRCPPPSRSTATWRCRWTRPRRWVSCCASLRMSAGPLLVEARPFDVYRGPQVGEGRVSYAIALRFQPEKAGDEKAVERAMNKLRGCAAAPPGGPDPLNEGPRSRPCAPRRVAATLRRPALASAVRDAHVTRRTWWSSSPS